MVQGRQVGGCDCMNQGLVRRLKGAGEGELCGGMQAAAFRGRWFVRSGREDGGEGGGGTQVDTARAASGMPTVQREGGEVGMLPCSQRAVDSR